MRYLPLDKREREAMLMRVGAPDIEALFADIPADMNEEELKISRSTPGFHMPTAA